MHQPPLPPGTSREDDPIALCLAGRISLPVMLARLALSGWSDAAIEHALAERPDAAPLLAFFRARAALLPQLRATVMHVTHTPGADPAHIGEQFDAALAGAPEASVAAYSLGDPALLAEATAELVGWLTQQGYFSPGMDVLDLGCGFGRIAAALAPQAASVLGLDVAPRMIAEAQRRYGAIRHLHFAATPGTGLTALPDAAFDLVLAVDSFPYLLLAGAEVARRHVRDVARVLGNGGRFVVLNLSYGDDPAADAARLARWAAAEGLCAEWADAAPFRLWDARAFVFARPHRIVRGDGLAIPPRFDATRQQSEDSR